MDPEQDARFREAVERKKAEAQEASEAPVAEHAGGSAVDGDQSSVHDAAHTQDAFSARDKNSQKGKVTADKWNQ
jgi:hypothetical protein